MKALVDTGSEVTTVTERWVQENLQHADLLPLMSRDTEGGKWTGDSIWWTGFCGTGIVRTNFTKCARVSG